MSRQFHERIEQAPRTESSSNRSFGLVFAVVFAIVGLWPLVGGGTQRLWALAVSVAFLLLALVLPGLLRPLNRAWQKLADLMQKIVSPVVLALLFFIGVMPIGLLMRIFGKDLLRLKTDPDAETYWIERLPPGPSPDSMRKQF